MNRLLIDLMGAILMLSGAASPEELPESDMERFEHYSRHPIPVNQVSRSRLLSSGLFSAYQVAALEEYRRTCGDILSGTELSLVDGIGPATAEALCHFLSFESSLPPGVREDRRIHQSLMLRGSVREKDGTETAAGLKYHIQIGERAELFWSTRNSYSAPDFSLGTISLAASTRRGARLLLGDFAARFGQGLALWSSLSLTGFGSVASFRRNATGFAPTGSFSPVFRGAAADIPLGRWTLGAALTGDARMAFVSYFGRKGQFGLQAVGGDGTVVSASGLLGLGHWTLSGEAALSSVLIETDGYVLRRTRPAAVGSISWAPSYKTRLALLARYYPSGFQSPYGGAPRSASKLSDEIGLAFGMQWKWAEMTFDAADHPEKANTHFKGILSLKPEFSVGKYTLAPSLRITERCRPADDLPWRHEVRADIRASKEPFTLNCRLDFVHSKDLSVLAYGEFGYLKQVPERTKWSLYLRATAFRADDWADRIYCYERDVPGSFSVPAYYGRGWSLSAIGGAKGRRHSFYLRGALVHYTGGNRKTSAELKIQYLLKI